MVDNSQHHTANNTTMAEQFYTDKWHGFGYFSTSSTGTSVGGGYMLAIRQTKHVKMTHNLHQYLLGIL